LNYIVEQYNITAKFGTFFMSHPVYCCILSILSDMRLVQLDFDPVE